MYFCVLLRRREAKSLTLQFGVINATDRLKAVTISGLLSRTALVSTRMLGVRLRARLESRLHTRDNIGQSDREKGSGSFR